MLRNYGDAKVKRNGVLLPLIIIPILVFIEIALGFQLFQKPNLIIMGLVGLIFIMMALAKLSDFTLYALAFAPPMLVSLANIKYGEIYALELLMGILIVIWIFKLLADKTLSPKDVPLIGPFITLAIIGIISASISYIFWDVSVTITHRSLFIQLADIALKVLPLGLIFLTYLISDNTENIKRFYKIFLGFSFLHILAAFFPLSTRAFSFDGLQAVSIFSLVFASFLFHKQNLSLIKRDVLLILSLGLLFAITKVTHLATLACLLVSALTISFMRSKKLFVVLLVIIIIFSFFNPIFWTNLYKSAEGEGSFARIPMAKAAFEVFKKHPLFGVGPANYYSYAITRNVGWELWGAPMANIHNNYLEILTEIGLFGFIALVWLIIAALKGLSKSFASVKNPLQKAFVAAALGNFIGFLIMSISGSFLLPGVHSGEFLYFNRAAYMWILVGIALSLPKFINKEQEETENKNENT
ncbi:MAG TPA: O-antigen ligase domain-containing protein [Actinobacteria bacterium]|nr:O-antigen ligase domain-containing protein [Actinomycetota bacterium]